MKFPLAPVPWDLFVIFTVTSATFGLSVYKIAYSSGSLVPGAFQQVQARTERAPASLRNQFEMVDLGCLERKLKQRISTSKDEIRFSGKFCNIPRSAMNSFGDVHVRNLTTGEEGTVRLLRSQAAFLSEGVQLTKGQNLIQIDWMEKSGAVTRSYIAELVDP